jgi:hypothetical protein
VYREVEEAALTAWPPLRQLALDGWQLRASEGYTRRANSVQALGASTRSLPDKVVECERWYAAERLRCAFRITPFSEARLEDFLEERGYSEEARSHVMVRPLGDADAAPDPEELELAIWLAEYARLSRLPTPPRALEPLVRSIPVERVTACVRDRSGRVVSVGMGVLDGPAFAYLQVLEGNEGARSLYVRLGFRRAYDYWYRVRPEPPTST